MINLHVVDIIQIYVLVEPISHQFSSGDGMGTREKSSPIAKQRVGMGEHSPWGMTLVPHYHTRVLCTVIVVHNT